MVNALWHGMKRVGRAMMLVLALIRAWWIEVAAFCAPPLALVIALCAPPVQAAGADSASIANVAAVQGAVTGLSLIALVFAVEMARRQEDRDDAVYDMMLRSVGIRAAFIVSIAALISTTIAMALTSLNVAAGATANLLICSYALVGLVSLTLLAVVLQTIRILRPTGVTEARMRANENERRWRVDQFVAQQRGDVLLENGYAQRLRPAYGDPLTSDERLVAEVNLALRNREAHRFRWAFDRLQDLVSASADQITKSDLSFAAPGEESTRQWYPLDALAARLPMWWRAAYEQDDGGFFLTMSSFQYWALMMAARRRSGELLEFGLQSSLTSYHVASPEVRAQWRLTWRNWTNLDSAVWSRLLDSDNVRSTREVPSFVERLVRHLQEYGNTILLADDVLSFGGMLTGFNDTFARFTGSRSWLSRDSQSDMIDGFNVREHITLVFLALIGRALLLEASERISDARPYVTRLHESVRDVAQIQRFTPQVFEHDHALQRQWSWWEADTNEEADEAFWIMPEQYPMLGLLYCLHGEQSTQALPSLDGYAQRFIDLWNTHADIVLKTAGVDPDDRDDASRRLAARLQTAVEAEHRERDDRAIGASIDPARVSDFMSGLREQRKRARVLEHRFEQVKRLQRLDGAEWAAQPFGHRWLLPREPFTTGTKFEALQLPGVGLAFERGLFVELDRQLGNARAGLAIAGRDVDDLLGAIDNGLLELAADQPLIVLHGKWPSEVISELWIRSDRRGAPLSFGGSMFRQEQVSYRGHWIAQSWTDGDPVLLMVDLDRWGWLLRAPIDGEDFALDLEEIDRQEAEKRADQAAEDERDREQRVRELMLKVRLTAQERTRFEVENPDAALRIPVRLDEDA